MPTTLSSVSLLVGEVEDLVEHLLLLLLDLAVLARAPKHQLQLRFGKDAFLASRARLDPEEPREGVRGFLEEPDEGVRGNVERLHGKRDPERGRLVPLERDRLRHELAERDVQVRHDRESQAERETGREDGLEIVLEERLTHGAEQQRKERNPELNRPDEADRVVHNPQRDPRPQVPLGSELVEPRPARRHERVLGRDEERVPQHDQENRDDLQENGHAPSSGAQVLGGISSSNYGSV
jgi:hypothetical protein